MKIWQERAVNVTSWFAHRSAHTYLKVKRESRHFYEGSEFPIWSLYMTKLIQTCDFVISILIQHHWCSFFQLFLQVQLTKWSSSTSPANTPTSVPTSAPCVPGPPVTAVICGNTCGCTKRRMALRYQRARENATPGQGSQPLCPRQSLRRLWWIKVRDIVEIGGNLYLNCTQQDSTGWLCLACGAWYLSLIYSTPFRHFAPYHNFSLLSHHYTSMNALKWYIIGKSKV